MTPNEATAVRMAMMHAKDRRVDKVIQVLEKMLESVTNPTHYVIVKPDGSMYTSGNNRSAWKSTGGFKVMIRNNMVRVGSSSFSGPKGSYVITPDGEQIEIEKFLIREGMIPETFEYSKYRYMNHVDVNGEIVNQRGYYTATYENGEYSEETYSKEPPWRRQ